MNEQQQKSHAPSLGRQILLILLIVAAIGFAVGDLFLYARQHSPGQTLFRVVQAEEYDTAKEICQNYYQDTPVPENVLTVLLANLTICRRECFSGQIDLESGEQKLQTLRGLGIPELTAQTDLVIAELHSVIESREAFALAEQYEAGGDEVSAIRQYRLVSETDTACYSLAQSRITACRERYRESQLTAIAAYESEGDYDNAISAISQTISVLGTDQELSAMLAADEQEKLSGKKAKVLEEARNSADQGNLSAAMTALRAMQTVLPDDAELASAIAGYEKDYLRMVQTVAGELSKNGDREMALRLLEEAEQLVPGADELVEVRQLLAAYVPVMLSDLNSRNFSDFTAAAAPLTAVDGTMYAASNLFQSYDDDMTGRQYSSGEFHLDGAFTVFTMTIAPMESFAEGKTVILEITGDGKPVESYTINRNTGVLRITPDVTGIKWLKLRVYPVGAEDLQSVGLILADGTVQKR